MADPTQPGADPHTDSADVARRWWIAAGAIAAAALVAVLVIVLASGGGDDDSVVVDGSTTSSSSTTLPPTSTSATPPVAPPSVAAFNAAPSPVTCSGSSENVSITWQTRDATGVVIEVDGAAQTDALPPNGTRPLPFSCNVGQHTYTLVVNGNAGQQVRQDIVVQGVEAPTTTPTQPPTTQPPLTTTTGEEPPTTTTTKPAVDKVAVDVTDDGTVGGEMTMTVVPPSSDGGKVTFTVENTGTQNHSFLVLKTDTPFDDLAVDPDTNTVSEDDKVGEINKIKPGKTKKLKLDLEPGHYVVLDNLPGHYVQGARAAFVVALGP
jgi:uncharacterized cupredoxin-like copper-binding protein